MKTIFVYGTLMQGYGNHTLIEGSEFIGEGVTLPEFTLLHLGGFPGLVHKGGAKVSGELYKVDTDTLRDVDRLEGHPGFYRRTPITIQTNDGEVEAEAYLLPEQWGAGRYTEIESGSWRVRK